MQKKRLTKVKEVCLKCASWTRNKAHGSYKCYCGSCPAKARDEVENMNKYPVICNRRIHRQAEAIRQGLK